MALVMAPIGSDLKREEGMLLGKIVPHHKDRLSSVEIRSRGKQVRLSAQCVDQCHYIACPMMVDVVRRQSQAREFLQSVVLLVRRVVGADHTKCPTAGEGRLESFDRSEERRV